jgi:hypothetical protein
MGIRSLSAASISTGAKRSKFWDQNTRLSSYESIATVTVGAGGASSVDFTSIPSTYTHLQIRGIGRTTTTNTDDNIYMQFNGDTTSNYAAHYLYGDGSNALAAGVANITALVACRITGASSTANRFGTTVVDILDYANTNKFKITRVLTAHDQNGSGYTFLLSGLWRSTSAISSIKLYVSPNNIAQYSQFALYGIKGA